MNVSQFARAIAYVSKEYGGQHSVLLDTGSMSEEGYEDISVIAVEKTMTGSDIDIVILWDDSAFLNGLGVESRYAMGVRFVDDAMQVVRRPEPSRGEFEVITETL